MLQRVAIIIMMLCFAGFVSAAEAPKENLRAITLPDYTGIWKGKCLFSSVEAHIRQDGDKIRGVALVRSLGEVNSYHFKGVVTPDGISAAHHKGHSFLGKSLTRNEVEGVVTTAKKGYELKLTAIRVADTPTKE